MFLTLSFLLYFYPSRSLHFVHLLNLNLHNTLIALATKSLELKIVTEACLFIYNPNDNSIFAKCDLRGY